MPKQSLFQLIKYVPSCDSSNSYLKKYFNDEIVSKNIYLRTDYQINGKGQGDNFWESEDAKNMLISLSFQPQNLLAQKQFYLSKWIAISLINLLSKYVSRDKLWIKWPNDIYYINSKIAGVLIENSIMGKLIKNSVIGIGINVNQMEFKSNAPNPISLRQILNMEFNIEDLSKDFINILNNVDSFSNKIYLEKLDESYINKLYWQGERHQFRIGSENKEATILGVDDYGFLKLLIDNSVQVFDIKQVVYVK